jgi:hypothetical protein
MNILTRIAICFTLVACASAPGLIVTDAPLQRSVARIVERHDAYVTSDQLLSEPDRQAALADSASAVLLVGLPEVSAAVLSATLEPVMQRHDSYVTADTALDPLERDTYLESSARIRGVLAAVPQN